MVVLVVVALLVVVVVVAVVVGWKKNLRRSFAHCLLPSGN